MSEIKFEKLEHIATLAETSGGYTLEVNLVSWNDKEAKVDRGEFDFECQKHRRYGKVFVQHLHSGRD